MEDGLSLRIWLTIAGVFVVLFVLPFAFLELDRRKRERSANRFD
jgi:hypothetical protein